MRTIRTTSPRSGLLLALGVVSVLLWLGCSAQNLTQTSTHDTTTSADVSPIFDVGASDSTTVADVSGMPDVGSEEVQLGVDTSITSDVVPADGVTPQHPPIRIVLPISTSLDKATFETFVRSKDNLKWLLEYSAQQKNGHRPRLLLQLSGEVAMLLSGTIPSNFGVEASVVSGQIKDALGLLSKWVDAKNELASEIPATVFDSGKSLFTSMTVEIDDDPCAPYGQMTAPSSAELLLNWQSHITFIDQLFGKLATMGGYGSTILPLVSATLPLDAERRYLMLSGQLSFGELSLAHGFNVDLSTSGRCFEKLFGHGPWDPWRASSSQILQDDSGSSILVLPKVGRLGSVDDPQSEHGLDALRRQFVQQVLERNYQIDAKLPARLWFFAVGARLVDLAALDAIGPAASLREQWKELIEWLNAHFVDEPFVGGVSVARYASVQELLSGSTLPTGSGKTSTTFSYDLKYANFEADPGLYPYRLLGLAKALINAHFSSFVDDLPGTSRGAVFDVCPDLRRDEKQCYWRAENLVGTPGCFTTPTFDASKPDSELRCPTQKVVVLWSSGTKEIVDLSQTKLYVDADSARDGLTGEPISAPITAIPISSNPTILQLKTD